MGWLIGGFVVLVGLSMVMSAGGKRPSAVHDPEGYQQAVNAPGIGCLLIIVGVIIISAVGGR